MTRKPAKLDPPRVPPVRFRVGVSGHRPPKLPTEAKAAVRASVDRVLAIIMECVRQQTNALKVMFAAPGASRPGGFEGMAAEFVLVSSLAEGADRIAAQAGLAAGFRFESVLPFDKAEYVKDFVAPESRAEFDELLGSASSVFALDGNGDERARAYEAAGFVMLANIDLLLAIWDGQEAAGVGGTAQIVSHAIADGIPIVWIDPTTPDIPRVSWSSSDEVPTASVRPRDTFRVVGFDVISTIIGETMAAPRQGDANQSLHRFLSEQERRWNLCPWFPLLLRIFADRPMRWTDFRLPAYLADTRKEWADYFEKLPSDKAQIPAIESILQPAYSMADHLAVYYSLVYRSTYVFNFLFAAFAVGLALCGVFIENPWQKSLFAAFEFVIIMAVLVTWLYGHRKQWHRRWLDYRRLAECLRLMRVLAPVGSSGPIDRPGRNLDIDEQDWVSWYAWSVRRLLPLPDCAVDAGYVMALRDVLRSAEIKGQLVYHEGNAERMAKLDHRMHRCGQWLFACTAVLCLLFVCFVWGANIPRADQPYAELCLHAVTFATALLPNLGAALAAIHVQGDFKVVAEQSKRTSKRLAAIDEIVAKEPPSFARLADRIEKTADVMMADLLEWQIIFRTRPLSLPA
jgi:hypothetical protein